MKRNTNKYKLQDKLRHQIFLTRYFLFDHRFLNKSFILRKLLNKNYKSKSICHYEPSWAEHKWLLKIIHFYDFMLYVINIFWIVVIISHKLCHHKTVLKYVKLVLFLFASKITKTTRWMYVYVSYTKKVDW